MLASSCAWPAQSHQSIQLRPFSHIWQSGEARRDPYLFSLMALTLLDLDLNPCSQPHWNNQAWMIQDTTLIASELGPLLLRRPQGYLLPHPNIRQMEKLNLPKLYQNPHSCSPAVIKTVSVSFPVSNRRMSWAFTITSPGTTTKIMHPSVMKITYTNIVLMSTYYSK